MELEDDCREAFLRLGLSIHQLPILASGKSVAFNLSGAAEGTVTVVQFATEARLRLGIFTIRNEGGGLMDFMTLESKGRAAAIAAGASELELMGIEITNVKLRTALLKGGFEPTTAETPDELGGGVFTDVISRIEFLKSARSSL